jgi:hypothetical protein
MKYAVIFAVFAALVTSQSLSIIPTCSKLCLDDVFPRANCILNDSNCVCAKADGADALVTSFLKAACSKDDEAEFREVVWMFCPTIGESAVDLQAEMERKIANRQGVLP